MSKNSVEVKVQKRSGFDKSHKVLTTLKCGTITPLLTESLIYDAFAFRKETDQLFLQHFLVLYIGSQGIEYPVPVDSAFIQFRENLRIEPV